MSEFLAMGGYAAFVWPTYGVAAAVLLGLLGLSVRNMRRREALVADLRRSRDSDRVGEARAAEAGA